MRTRVLNLGAFTGYRRGMFRFATGPKVSVLERTTATPDSCETGQRRDRTSATPAAGTNLSAVARGRCCSRPELQLSGLAAVRSCSYPPSDGPRCLNATKDLTCMDRCALRSDGDVVRLEHGARRATRGRDSRERVPPPRVGHHRSRCGRARGPDRRGRLSRSPPLLRPVSLLLSDQGKRRDGGRGSAYESTVPPIGK